eukprot:1149509-Pelagomonas_calceolata.AAC.7
MLSPFWSFLSVLMCLSTAAAWAERGHDLAGLTNRTKQEEARWLLHTLGATGLLKSVCTSRQTLGWCSYVQPASD